MKATFRSLISDLDAVVDKDLAYEQIKQKIWPLAGNKKPTKYFEKGDTENEDKAVAAETNENTRELNHYIKWYLFLTK